MLNSKSQSQTRWFGRVAMVVMAGTVLALGGCGEYRDRDHRYRDDRWGQHDHRRPDGQHRDGDRLRFPDDGRR